MVYLDTVDVKFIMEKNIFYIHTYIHTYHPRFIPEGVACISNVPSLAMRNTADVTGGKPIAVLLQSISGVSAIL
jgi:hypothetical protein